MSAAAGSEDKTGLALGIKLVQQHIQSILAAASCSNTRVARDDYKVVVLADVLF